ncbi:MAG TPA: potassium-transporting ATPase subunit C [Acidimicrobiales bacterium]|nr:potassium-transporting ATPase subunit C [Acidimicrobiales bacterium]
MITHLRRSVVAVVVFTVFFGFVYAFAGTGVAQLFFKHQADGSITADGSTLIGQNWSVTSTFDGTKGYWPSTRWFNGRPDDTGPYGAVVCGADAPKGCTPASGGDNPLEANGVSGESSATNLGPRSKVLVADTTALVAWWHSHGIDPTPDLVTTSGSGLDPDISPADALVQVPMIARSLGVAPSALRALIARETNGEQLGFLGGSYIDVLQLNEGLAKLR